MYHRGKVMKKLSFLLFLVLVFFSGCSGIQNHSSVSSISFKSSDFCRFISNDTNEFLEEKTYKLVIGLHGDYTASKTMLLELNNSDKVIIFDRIPIGSELYTQADIYECSGKTENDITYQEKHLYTGKSNNIVISSGDNYIDIKLKRIITNGDVDSINVTVPEYTENQPTISYEISENGNIITFSVKEKYETYIWKIDGNTIIEATGESVSIKTEDYPWGTHSIILVVTDSSGTYYSSALTFTIQKTITTGILTVEAPVYSSKDLELSFTATSDENKYIFSADSGYKTYIWKIDGKHIQEENSNSITLDISKYAAYTGGIHNILLVVTDLNENIYSASLNFSIKEEIKSGSIIITTPDYSQQEVNIDCAFENNTYIFTAENIYKTYTWLIDGNIIIDELSNTLRISNDGLEEGLHLILLVVSNFNDEYYSGTTSFSFTHN